VRRCVCRVQRSGLGVASNPTSFKAPHWDGCTEVRSVRMAEKCWPLELTESGSNLVGSGDTTLFEGLPWFLPSLGQ
jgi:hypothetical protein